MKVLKSIGLVLLVLLLLVSIVSASNHTVAFWQLINKDTSPYLCFYEDFSDLTWTESPYSNTGTSQYISNSGVRVIPYGGRFSTDRNFLTLYLDDNQSGFPSIHIPYNGLRTSIVSLDKITYFVVTFELWTETIAPKYFNVRNCIVDSDYVSASKFNDFASLSYSNNYKNNVDYSNYSNFTFVDRMITLANSSSKRDRICCVVEINPDVVEDSIFRYYVNGIENEISYSHCIESTASFISTFEIATSSSYASSLSIDNFSVYAFDRDFNGDIKDVLKEVNYK